MIRLTERYSAENLEPLCDGWKMGIGYDARLDRSVVILSMSLSSVDHTGFDAWLAKRVTVSHPYTTELLDGAALESDFICVFEGAGSTRAGLPDMPRQELLSACLCVLRGAEALHGQGVGYHFSAGQVLWDGKEPRVLGLMPADGKQVDESQPKLARNLGLYFGHLCQWNVSSQIQSGNDPQMSPLFRLGLEKLLGQGSGGCASFAEVSTTLQAMLMEDGHIAGSAPTGRREDGALSHAAGNPAVLSDEARRQARFDDARAGRTSVDAGMDAAGLRNEMDDGAVDDDDWVDDQGESSGTLRRSLIGGVLIAGALLVGIVAVNQWKTVAQGTVAAGSGSAGQSSSAGQQTQTPGSKGASGGSPGSTPSSGSSQPQSGTIPNVAGMTPQSAISQLVAAGIAKTRIGVESIAGSGAAGRVTATMPTAGSSLQSGQSVVMQVDVPAGEQLVPNLVGLPLKTAENTLLQDKFHFAYTDHSESGSAVGTVYSQTPLPYSIAAPWTNVHFVVASHY